MLREVGVVGIIMDQGGEFVSKMNAMLSQFYSTNISFITKGSPRSNGRVERFNQTLINYLAKAKLDERWSEDWEPLVQVMCMHYNATYNRMISLTPYFARYGIECNMPQDVLFGVAGDKLDGYHSAGVYTAERVKNHALCAQVIRREMSRYLSERDVKNALARGRGNILH